RLRKSTLSPYTTLFRSEPQQGSFVLYGYEDEMTFKQYFTDLFQVTLKALNKNYGDLVLNKGDGSVLATAVYAEVDLIQSQTLLQDRKSTRLNSSHVKIS